MKGFKRPKYRNVRTEYRGMPFDSKAEAEYARQLDLRQNAGEIKGWTRQVPFMLGVPENKYRADFLVFHNDGTVEAVDVKGMETPKFKRDVKLWQSYGPCPLRIVSKSNGRVVKENGNG